MNVLRTVVVHLGLNSFWLWPYNLWLSRVGLKNFALPILSLSFKILWTSIRSLRWPVAGSLRRPVCAGFGQWPKIRPIAQFQWVTKAVRGVCDTKRAIQIDVIPYLTFNMHHLAFLWVVLSSDSQTDAKCLYQYLCPCIDIAFSAVGLFEPQLFVLFFCPVKSKINVWAVRVECDKILINEYKKKILHYKSVTHTNEAVCAEQLLT